MTDRRASSSGETTGGDRFQRAMLDPASTFESVQALLEDPDLTAQQQQALLKQWLDDLKLQQVATDENMAGPNVAQQLEEVTRALRRFTPAER